MIEPEVTGSGVEDGAEDDDEVSMGAVKVRQVHNNPERKQPRGKTMTGNIEECDDYDDYDTESVAQNKPKLLDYGHDHKVSLRGCYDRRAANTTGAAARSHYECCCRGCSPFILVGALDGSQRIKLVSNTSATHRACSSPSHPSANILNQTSCTTVY